MKNLLLATGLGVLGYFAYLQWSPTSAPAPSVETTPDPTPEPIDPWLRGRVGRLFDEWKRRNASTDRKQHVYMVDMAEILSEIRMRGPFTDQVIASQFTRILVDLGVSREEAGAVANGIMKEAARDGLTGGHHRASKASENESGGGPAP